MVEVDDEHHIVSKTTYSCHRWHPNNETEEVVDECVETFVNENLPRKMSDGLEFVVEEQLWKHQGKTHGVTIIVDGQYKSEE